MTLNISLSSKFLSSFSSIIFLPIYRSIPAPVRTIDLSKRHSFSFSISRPAIITGIFTFSLYSITLQALSFSSIFAIKSLLCIAYTLFIPSISCTLLTSSSVKPSVEIIFISYKLLLSTYLSKLSNISGLVATNPA